MSTTALTLRCANCGAQAAVSAELDQFTCDGCGTHQVVERQGETQVLKLIEDALARVHDGTDSTTTQLAISRLEKELIQATAKFKAMRAAAATQKQNIDNQGVFGAVGSVVLGIGLIVVVARSERILFAAIAGAVFLAACLIMTYKYTRQLRAELAERTQPALNLARQEVLRINAELARHKALSKSE